MLDSDESVELSWKTCLLISAGIFAFVLGLFLLSFKTYFHGGESFEFCHYAEIADNILHGRGLSTVVHFPIFLAYFAHLGVRFSGAGPSVDRFVFFSYWSALWSLIGGGGDFGMALGNGVAHALWVILLYWVGRWLFNERTATISALLWTLNPMMLAGHDLFGYPDVLFGVFFGFLNVLYYQALCDSTLGTPRVYFGIGLLAGGAYLTRESFIFWLPLYLASPLVVAGRRRWSCAAAFLLAFLIPWTVWAFHVGDKLGALNPQHFMQVLAKDTIGSHMPWAEYRVYTYSDFMTPGILGKFMHKFLSYLGLFMRNLPNLWLEALLIPFAIAGMLTAPRPASGLATWLSLLFGWQLFVFSFLHYEYLSYMSGRYYLWFAPFIILYAVAFFERRCASRLWSLTAIVVLGYLLHYWVVGYRSIPRKSDHPSHQSIGSWPEIVYMRENVPANAWILTNIPAQLAWYGKRRAILIPIHTEDVPHLMKDWTVNYIFLSYHRIGELYNFTEWQRLLTESPNSLNEMMSGFGFKLEKTFDEGVLFRKVGTGVKPK